jgi:hypothetical protein
MSRCLIYGHAWFWRAAIRRRMCAECFRID